MACDLLFSDYQDIAEGLNTMALVQLMTVFHAHKYQRQELWYKLEQLLATSYHHETAADESSPVQLKENLFTLLKLATDRRLQHRALWELVHRDVASLLPQLELKELAVVLDSYYKVGATEPRHSRLVAQRIADYKLPDLTRELSLNEALRMFRGLFNQGGLGSEQNEVF